MATLIRDLVLTVTSGVGDSIVTHVDFKDVAAIPPANTARKILFDQVNKFLVALGIKSIEDWGEIGSSSSPWRRSCKPYPLAKGNATSKR